MSQLKLIAIFLAATLSFGGRPSFLWAQDPPPVRRSWVDESVTAEQAEGILNARYAAERVVPELPELTQTLVSRFPPDQFHFVALGRSPYVPLRAVELRHPGSVSYLPLSSFRYMHRKIEDASLPGRLPVVALPLSEDMKEELFRYFDEVIPRPEVLGGRQLVLVDYSSHVASSLSSAQAYLREYLELRGRSSQIRSLAFLDFSTAGFLSRTGENLNQFLARGVTDGLVLPRQLGTALKNQLLDGVAPYTSFSLNSLRDGRSPWNLPEPWVQLSGWMDGMIRDGLIAAGVEIPNGNSSRREWPPHRMRMEQNLTRVESSFIPDAVSGVVEVALNPRDSRSLHYIIGPQGNLLLTWGDEYANIPLRSSGLDPPAWTSSDGITFRRDRRLPDQIWVTYRRRGESADTEISVQLFRHSRECTGITLPAVLRNL